MSIGLALIVYELVPILTLKADEIVPIGLAVIVSELVSMLKLKTDKIVPSGLSLIVYKIMSGLTLIAQDSAGWFGIDSLQDYVWFDIDSKVRLSCTWIEMGLGNPSGVGHLLHI